MKPSMPTTRPLVHGFCACFKLCVPLLALGFCIGAARAQVNTGSDGHDGAFNPTQNVTIDMADHPDGIYQYASVNIPSGVTVAFKPNARNSPVVWLVQSNCTVAGVVSVAVSDLSNGTNTIGGPGGYGGGNAGNYPTPGAGPGGGSSSGGCASYGTVGQPDGPPIYGNDSILPLIGGSGGGGGGAGGGGAILIAASGEMEVSGTINATGGYVYHYAGFPGGGGSGGAIRLIAPHLKGNGSITAAGGGAGYSFFAYPAGSGRVRFDVLQNNFGGNVTGVFTQGFQPIIIPAAGQSVQLSIVSVGSNAVPANPSGTLINPDLVIPGQQNNPIPVVVRCTNVPLNTEISVVIHPANGADVQAVGLNNVGTVTSSTATVSLNLPHGGGIIYAKCVSGVVGGSTSAANGTNAKTPSLAETGLTANGERFKAVEITSALGSKQQTTYVTESGKRYAAPSK